MCSRERQLLQLWYELSTEFILKERNSNFYDSVESQQHTVGITGTSQLSTGQIFLRRGRKQQDMQANCHCYSPREHSHCH
jgi:hypothetical protein